MLTGQEMQLITVAGLAGIVAGAVPGFIYLKKNNKLDTEKIISEVKEGLNATEPILAAIKEVTPENKVVNVLELIEKWAKYGVEKAEQLYHVSQLKTNEERFNAAKETAYTALKENNIEPTENQKKLIKDVIYASVNGLGHKDKTEAQKEVEKQALQSQVTQLTTENTNLKNAINTITNAANTVG